MSDPNPIDVEVGARLRVLRKLRGLSQSDLAERLGLTFQQVQKYERGANRISASKLWQVAEILKVPVSELFGDPNPAEGGGDQGVGPVAEADLLRAWNMIQNEPQRRAVLNLVRSMGPGKA